MTDYQRRRRGHVRTTVRDLLLLVVLCAVVWLAGHLFLFAVVAALGAGGFFAGRRYRRRKPRAVPGRARVRQAVRRPQAATTTPFPAIPAGPDPSDQIARLEAVTGRDIETVIESYRLRQQKYGGRP